MKKLISSLLVVIFASNLAFAQEGEVWSKEQAGTWYKKWVWVRG